MARLALPDYGRGLAALIVLLFHLRSDYPLLQEIPIVRIGNRWVDFFFAMSGYLLYMLYGEKRISIIYFLKRRVLRLYPLVLWSSTVYMLLMLWRADVSYRIILVDYLDVIMLLNSTTLLGYSFHVNPVSWSISAEFFAYLCLAISLQFIPRRGKILYFLTILVASSIVLILNGFEQELKFGFVRGIFGFSLGIISFYVFDTLKVKQELLFGGGLFFFISSFFLGTDHLALLTCYLGLFILMPSLFSKRLNQNTGHYKILEYLGSRSFSIYMNHAILVGMIHFGLNLYLALPIFILYNEIVYQYIEIKLSRYLRVKYG
jgi:peptidoglycan/LPS O-acetylase OafA/YrhL